MFCGVIKQLSNPSPLKSHFILQIGYQAISQTYPQFYLLKN